MTDKNYDKLVLERARRTAFISRFIVLREGKKSKAHRQVEALEWADNTTTEELLAIIKEIFASFGDNASSVDRDLKRAKAHADRLNPFHIPESRPENYETHFSLWPLIEEYNKRSCTNFVDALFDYERSNKLLFGDEAEQPKLGGWRLPRELLRNKQPLKSSIKPKGINKDTPVVTAREVKTDDILPLH